MTDVHIVGAGPAGCITAVNAIENNYKVHISEEHERSGVPTNCSGLFSKAGLEKLKKYSDYKKHIINEIHGADIYFDDVLFSVRKETVAFVCDRAGLDSAFAEKAEKEGAGIKYKEKIKNKFKAKNIIGCDGPNSTVAKHFGFPEISRFVGTLQKKVKYKSTEKDVVEVYLSSKIPGFFGWSIPHNEEECELGVGVELPNKVKSAWDYFSKLKGIEADNPSASIIPVMTRQRAGKIIEDKNVLLVGDAAGQTKATTGGGVLFGAWCAEIAGKDVTKPRWYDLEWRLKYGNDLTIHRKIRNYLNTLDDKGLRTLGKQLNEINLDEYLEKHGSMDKPLEMLNPELIRTFLNAVTISVFPNGPSSQQ